MLLTKQQIIDRLPALARSRAGEVRPIGGECFAICIAGEIRAVVAVDEWKGRERNVQVNVPQPLLDLVLGDRILRGFEVPSAHRAVVMVSDEVLRSFIHLSLVSLAGSASVRSASNRNVLRSSFVVERSGWGKYAILTKDVREDITLGYVDSFTPLESLLDVARSDLEDQK